MVRILQKTCTMKTVQGYAHKTGGTIDKDRKQQGQAIRKGRKKATPTYVTCSFLLMSFPHVEAFLDPFILIPHEKGPNKRLSSPLGREKNLFNALR